MRQAGTFRILIDGTYSTVGYADFYHSWTDAQKELLYEKYRSNRACLFCGCNEEDILPLMITKDRVIRVKENGRQDEHMPFCPKSENYSSFIELNNNGILQDQDMCYYIRLSIPSGVSHSSGGSSSTSSAKSESATHRTTLKDIARLLNYYALEKQTFSIKRKIKQREPWEYKDSHAMIRLMYGCANDIKCLVSGAEEPLPLSSVAYHPAKYFANFDYRRQFWFFAIVDKLGEFNPKYKYQYVYLRMKGRENEERVKLRVETEMFAKLFLIDGKLLELPLEEDGFVVLTGYLHRRYFPAKDDKPASDNMELSKGTLCRINKYGILSDNEYLRKATDLLCSSKIIFTKPLFQVEELYGEDLPDFMIKRYHDKSCLIGIVSAASYRQKVIYEEVEHDTYQIKVLRKQRDMDDFMENFQIVLEDIGVMKNI